MPYVLKPNKLFVKNPDGNGFLPQNIITDQATDDAVADIEAAGQVAVDRVNTTISNAQSDMADLESREATIASAIASMAELGTDTTLSVSGMAADAKAAGDGIAQLKNHLDSVTEYSRNLFDKDTSVRDYHMLNSSGKYMASNDSAIIIIPIEPETTYTVSKIAKSVLRIGTSSSMPVNGDILPYANGVITDDKLIATITAGADDHYLVMYVYNSTVGTATYEEILDSLQVEVGNEATDYTPFYFSAVDVTARSKAEQTQSNLQAFESSIMKQTVNLFDKDNAVIRYSSISGSNGKMSDNANARSVILPCEKNTTYTISKIKSARLVFACYQSIPVSGSIASVFASGTNNASVATITTDSDAAYLAAFVYLSTDVSAVDLQDILDSIQIEIGDTATLYQPYGEFPDDAVARSAIKKLSAGEFAEIKAKRIYSDAVKQEAVYGSNLVGEIDTFTSDNGAVFDQTAWKIGNSQSIKTNVAIVEGKVYDIVIGIGEGSAQWVYNQPNTFTVKLGNDTAGFFFANDNVPRVDIVASVTGTVVLELLMGADASGRIFNVEVREVVSYPDTVGAFNAAYDILPSGDNISIGGGLKKLTRGKYNVGFGYKAQENLGTARGNTGIGYLSQRNVKNGSYNTAVGDKSQMGLTEGMYNCAFGHLAQVGITKGCWNTAVGIESQLEMTEGCNNTTVGRRAHTKLSTGNGNTAVGAQAGYVNDLDDTSYRTTTANFQTLVGFDCTQAKSASYAQRDYATAFGAFARAGENATAIGPKTSATGAGSVAIGCDNQGNGASATGSNQVVIGTALHSIVLAGHKINFNQDGTITWEALT